MCKVMIVFIMWPICISIIHSPVRASLRFEIVIASFFMSSSNGCVQQLIAH